MPAKLTGDWALGAIRFRPNAELIWFHETAKGYSNAIGIDIAGQSNYRAIQGKAQLVVPLP